MTVKKKIIVVGGHEQACRMLDYLVDMPEVEIVLCIARKDDEGQDSVFPSLLGRAKIYNIPSIQPYKLNDDTVLNTVRRLDPDIVLSLQNNMIFGDDWIELLDDNLGIVNVHYAPLPKYAGYWPEMWAIWNGESKFAVSMHYVEKGLDTGPIIAQKWFDIDSQESRQTLYKKSEDHCFKMLLENLDKVLADKVEGLTQNETERTYFPKSLPNDGFLDLSWDPDTQSRFIRAIAFPGFPGPKIKVGEHIYTILEEDLPFFEPVRLSKTN